MSAAFRQAGLTMVEILVALALGLFLTSGILSVYLGSKQTYRVVEALARSQENGRYAVEQLGRTIRMAGYVGCARLDGSLPVNVIVNPREDVEFSNENFVNVDIDEDVVALRTTGTDVLVIRGGGGSMARLNAEWSWNANVKIAGNANDWVKGDILMIADCSNVDIFRATNVSKDPNSKGITITHAKSGNTDNKLSKVYTKGADVMSYRETTFFIAASSQAKECKEPCRGLWRRLGDRDPQEILEGVENMQILFGMDTTGTRALDSYMTAEAVEGAKAWGRVVAVRINLLLVSPEDNLIEGPRSIVFNGEELEPDDRRMRRVLTTTVAIRNRLP